MEEKNNEIVEQNAAMPEQDSGFVRKYLKIIVTAIIMAALLITVGIYAIDKKAGVEAKQSSFKLTTFDYVITAPSKEQVTELSKDASVSKIFPCYNFEISVGGVRFPVLMCDSLDSYEVSLFNEDTCISGKADASGIMLDETAAAALKVKVGDTVSFAMGGRQVSLKVSGIYMASTYDGLNKGLGLCIFTDEMKSYFKNEITYKLAFIDAADEAACATALNGYIPRGEMVTEAAYIENRRKTDSPADNIYDEWLTSVKADYVEYKNNFEKGSYPNAVQIKANFMKDVTDQVETRDSDVTYISVILGIASFIAYAALGILFVYMNKRDDEISLREGVPHEKMLSEYMRSNVFGALFVALITGVVLLIVALLKHHLVACLPIVLVSALPVLPAAVIVAMFIKVYLNKLYSVHIDRE